MYYDIKNVKYLHDYTLEIVFNDGVKGTADFSDYANRGGVFSKFEDVDFFKQVFVNEELGVLTWPDDIDIAPETIYTKVTGKPLKQAI